MLRLGILPGIKHTAEFLNPKRRSAELAAHVVLTKLKCLDCGHSSKSHSRRRSLYVGMSRADLSEMIKATGFPGSGGFAECQFYYCDECDEKQQATKDANQYLKDCSCDHMEDQLLESEKRSNRW